MGRYGGRVTSGGFIMTTRLVIADVDGTLVTRSKVLTVRTCEAVARLRARGVQFTVTSGRPPRGLKSIIEALQLTAPVAAFNGAVYIRPDLQTVLAERTIPSSVASQVVEFLLRAGLDVWVYQGSDWFIRNPDAPRVARERGNVGFDPTVVDDLRAALTAPLKIVGVSEDLPLVARCEAELSTRLGTDAAAARSQPYYLDVTHPEANKGMVVREASRLLKIPLAEIAAVGDMPNDIPMLVAAGVGIAMGNAVEEVRRAARHVTRSNEDDGFAHAVDTFILGDPAVTHSGLGLPHDTRACLFGIDVIVQTSGLHAQAWKHLFDFYLRRRADALGQPFVPFDPVRDYGVHLDGRPTLEGARSFLAARGIELPDATVRALVERKGELLLELLRHQKLETFEGSVRFVRAARESGLRIAAVSPSAHSDQILRAAGIASLFDACVTEPDGGDVPAAVARSLGADAEETAVFEDTPMRVAAARAGHFGYVVAVDRTNHAAELARCGADAVVPDLTALIESEETFHGVGPKAAA